MLESNNYRQHTHTDVCTVGEYCLLSASYRFNPLLTITRSYSSTNTLKNIKVLVKLHYSSKCPEFGGI